MISKTKFWVSRLKPRLVLSQSQFWDGVRDWTFVSLNYETESETEIYKSQFRDRVRDWIYQSLNIKTESETKILRASILRPRLDLSESQYWDRIRDWNHFSLSLETESETIELVKTESLAILCHVLNYQSLQRRFSEHGKNNRNIPWERKNSGLTRSKTTTVEEMEKRLRI